MGIINMGKIHPGIRSQLEKGLRFVEEENQNKEIISKIIIFGSAITSDYSEKSDIDICLFSDYDTKNMDYFRLFGGLPLVINESCDIIDYKDAGPALRREIDKKGVVVYEYVPL